MTQQRAHHQNQRPFCTGAPVAMFIDRQNSNPQVKVIEVMKRETSRDAHDCTMNAS